MNFSNLSFPEKKYILEIEYFDNFTIFWNPSIENSNGGPDTCETCNQNCFDSMYDVCLHMFK